MVYEAEYKHDSFFFINWNTNYQINDRNNKRKLIVYCRIMVFRNFYWFKNIKGHKCLVDNNVVDNLSNFFNSTVQ